MHTNLYLHIIYIIYILRFVILCTQELKIISASLATCNSYMHRPVGIVTLPVRHTFRYMCMYMYPGSTHGLPRPNKSGI